MTSAGGPDAEDGWKDVYRDEAFADRYERKRATARSSKRRHARELRIVERALDACGLPAGSRALDVPTGQGRFIPALRARGLDVVAVDIAAPMLVRARRAAGDARVVRFAVADVERLPFRDAQFDLVLVVRLLHHAPDAAARGRMLAECARVSRRFVLLSFFHAVALSELKNALFSLLRPFARTRHALTTGRLAGEARAAGLALRAAWPELRFIKRHWFALFERTAP